MSNDNGASAIQRRGLMLVLSSPSGAGKTALSRQLLDNDKQISAQRVVHDATEAARRARRGRHYRFVDTPTFRGMIERKQKAILTAERLKRERQVGMSGFVKALREGGEWLADAGLGLASAAPAARPCRAGPETPRSAGRSPSRSCPRAGA